MDVKDMTPQQLREYAMEKERAHDSLVSRYMDVPASPRFERVEGGKSEPEPWEQDVEFEGETYRMDMRRVKSREFFRLYAPLQEAAEDGGEQRVSDMLALYDFLFAGKVDDKVSDVVCKKLGYDDFEEIVRIETGIFEAVGAKN